MKGLKIQRTWSIAALLLVATFVLASCDMMPGLRGAPVTPTPFEALPPRKYIWQEGEIFLSQTGSEATDFKGPASDGKCLGMGWGGHEGDFVEYEVSIPLDLPSAVLYLRYAREGQTDGALDVYVNGQLIGVSPSMTLQPTGGWGYEAAQWWYQELPLGAMEEGDYRIKFVSQVDGGGINIDGFFIADASFRVPSEF